ncbi:hypothetical protein COHA_008208 [Chlorella ohadii]|uniref:Uncharacterized protein n=1 Tax=Chlorella ohadii TaxID=2649997 RepID=A0AAD5H3G9_9CHLO|nr:hypothetical protein COHA_008208 [Chlorella ohadii]
MSSERAGFGQAALTQLPAELEAQTPTKKGAGQKRKPVEVPQVNEEVEQARALRSAKTATRPRKPKATPEEEAAELDAHNRNRIAVSWKLLCLPRCGSCMWRAAELDVHNGNCISSMDEGKLRTRIKRISNVAKLKSFIAALEESGNTGLAAEARAKLVQLQTGVPADSE